jgi:hypothetical protein
MASLLLLADCAPGGNVGTRSLGIGKVGDRFQGRLHVCIGRHENAHVVVAAGRHGYEVDCEGDVNALLAWTFSQLMTVRPASRVTGRIGQTAVDTDLLQLAIKRTVIC